MKLEYFDDFEGPNEYSFLSNFYVHPFLMNGLRYSTGEHAFQAFKATDPYRHERIRTATTPSAAKRLGRGVLFPNWEAIKYDVMRQVLRAKFSQGGELAEKLLDTGDALLLEGNTLNDRVWGVTRPSMKGRNWLGHLLMARRAELRSGEAEADYSVSMGFIK